MHEIIRFNKDDDKILQVLLFVCVFLI